VVEAHALRAGLGEEEAIQRAHVQSLDDKIYTFLYIVEMVARKPVEFVGSSLDDLRSFPLAARRPGRTPARPGCSRVSTPTTGSRCPQQERASREIRIRDASGAFRVMYVAKLADAIYVLHCFHKKTQRTSRLDLDLATSRYRELMKEHRP
jgi:phage-related protein